VRPELKPSWTFFPIAKGQEVVHVGCLSAGILELVLPPSIDRTTTHAPTPRLHGRVSRVLKWSEIRILNRAVGLRRTINGKKPRNRGDHHE